MDAEGNPFRYPISRLAAALPGMTDSDFQAFKNDLEENGQQDPIRS